jgi:ribonucleoside-diphosphate reductase alpha chain
MSEIFEPIKTASSASQIELSVNEPGILKTIKRNGKVTSFDENKIKVAITKAYLAVEGVNAAMSNRIHEQIDELCAQISQAFKRRLPTGGSIHIEDIQDQVELVLMRNRQYKVARAYVLYREERRKARELELNKPAPESKIPLILMPRWDITTPGFATDGHYCH